MLASVWVLGPLLLLTRCCLAPRTPWPAHIRSAYTGPSFPMPSHVSRALPPFRPFPGRPDLGVGLGTRRGKG